MIVNVFLIDVTLTLFRIRLKKDRVSRSWTRQLLTLLILHLYGLFEKWQRMKMTTMITERCAPTLSSPPPFQLLPLPTTTSCARDDPPVRLRDGKQVLMNLPRKHHHTISTLQHYPREYQRLIEFVQFQPHSSPQKSLLFRLLFLSVHWARRLPVFRSLPYSTQVGINLTSLCMYVHIMCHSIYV